MNRWRRRGVLAAYLFILPNLVGFLLFTSLPVLASLTLSFFEWDLLHWPPRWVGLGNFSELLADASFWKYFWNTLVLMAGIREKLQLADVPKAMRGLPITFPGTTGVAWAMTGGELATP